MKLPFVTLILLSSFGANSFAQTPTPIPAIDEENQFSQILNQFRSALNLPTLASLPQLQTVAQLHSDWMNANSYLDHYEPTDLIHNPNQEINGPFDRMKAQGYSEYFYAGENIACGNSDALKTFRQWAFSPGHLQNMVNPHYHEMGIARSGDGLAPGGTRSYCPYYWTNDFGSVVDPENDPAGTTDLNLIAAAIVQVSGPIPVGITVSLTEPTPTPTPLPTPVAVAPISAPAPPPVAPVPATAVSANATQAPNSATTIQSLHCTIPYSVGQDILTTFQNTDTELDATRDDDGTYSVKLSYLQNGQPSNILPILMSGLSMIHSPDYPVFTLISAPGSRVGGYSIEVDLGANHAQFDSYGVSPQVTSSLVCTVQY